MKKMRFVVGLGVLALGGAGAIVVACGGGDAAQCGAGTVLLNGVCQVAANDGSAADVTVGQDGEVTDGAIPTDGGGGDAVVTADGGDGGVAPNRCPYGKGPAMAELPDPGVDAGTFCMDTTEVTEAQYDQFVKDKNGNTGGQILECAWNSSYNAGYDQSACPPYLYKSDPQNHPNLPVRCIDWCDAKAFCDWSGKKLCNQLDGTNGSNRDTSRWYWACTNGNGTTHPEGNVSNDTCWLPNSSDAGPVDVGTVGCKGKFAPYSQVNDLLGNVAEWQGYCGDGGNIPGMAPCAAFGGSYSGYKDSAGCGVAYTALSVQRYVSGRALGFRCCAD